MSYTKNFLKKFFRPYFLIKTAKISGVLPAFFAIFAIFELPVFSKITDSQIGGWLNLFPIECTDGNQNY